MNMNKLVDQVQAKPKGPRPKPKALVISCSPEFRDAFRKACQKRGVPQVTIVKAFMQEFINSTK